MLSSDYFISFKGSSSDAIMTFETRPNKLGRLLGKKTKRWQVRGGCTVWHFYPSGKRCSTFMESWLSDIWQREVWKLRDK